MSQFKRWMKSAGVSLLAVVTLCSCATQGTTTSSAPQTSSGGETESSASSKESQESAEPTEISITFSGFSTDALNPESPIFLKLQELTNTKLNLNIIPDSAYKDKLSAMIAGNTLPEVIYLPDMTTNTTVTAIKAGIFWEIGPYLSEYENLSQVSEDGWIRASVEGKIYGLFRERNLARLGIQYREDWAENVGITKPPETIDEFYDMCVKFTNNDPDGNGVDDTFAVSFQSSMATMPTILSWFGAGPGKNFEMVDGEIRHVMQNEGYYEGLKFIRKLYEEGLCNQDFISVTQRADNFRAGKAGILLSSVEDAVKNYTELAKLIPDAKVRVSGPVDAGHGLNAAADTSGSKGSYAFPTTVVKDEEQLKGILEFFDKMNTTEVNNLLKYGIEGVHYTVEDGKAVYTDEQTTLRLADANDLSNLQTFSLTINPAMPEKMNDLQQQIQDVLAVNDQYARPSATSGLVSETESKKGAELRKSLEDAQAKFVMGQISEEELRAAFDKWLADGGTDILNEYNESYQKALQNVE